MPTATKSRSTWFGSPDRFPSALEVTQAQYALVMGNNPGFFCASGGGKGRVAGRSTDQHPVESVSWMEAILFCNKLSEKEHRKPFYEIDGENIRVPDWSGPGYRLPTEAEWEYACRANTPTATRYSFGNDAANIGEFAWFDGNSGAERTQWRRDGETRSGYMTCTETSGSGAGIGTAMATVMSRPPMIPSAWSGVCTGSCVAGRTTPSPPGCGRRPASESRRDYGTSSWAFVWQ